MSKNSDTILALGLVAGGLYAVYALTKPLQQAGGGIGTAFQGAGEGVYSATTGAGQAAGLVFRETGETFQGVTDTLQEATGGLKDTIGTLRRDVGSAYSWAKTQAVNSLQPSKTGSLRDTSYNAMLPDYVASMSLKGLSKAPGGLQFLPEAAAAGAAVGTAINKAATNYSESGALRKDATRAVITGIQSAPAVGAAVLATRAAASSKTLQKMSDSLKAELEKRTRLLRKK